MPSGRPAAWQRLLGRYAVFTVAWAAVLIVSWLTWEWGRELGGTASWAGLLHPVFFGLTAWPVLRDFAHGRRWLTIPNAVLGLTYLGVGLGSVYFVVQFETLTYAALRKPALVRTSLLVALVGIVVYRIGAEGPRYGYLTRNLPPLPSTPAWSWGVRLGMYAALSLSVAVQLYLAATGSLGYTTTGGRAIDTALWSVLIYLSEVGLLALAGAYYYWFSGAPLTRGDRVGILLATGILAALGLLAGMKEEFLFVLFGAVIPYRWVRSRDPIHPERRWREGVFGVALVGGMLLLFSVNPLYRDALRQFSATEDRVAQGQTAATAVLERLSAGGDVDRLVAVGAERAWERLSIFPYHLAVVDQVPETRPFRGFDRYPLLPAVALIPRAVWPDKPVNSAGEDFQRRFISEEVVYSTTPTVFGWGFIEWGTVGVVIVMVALGVIAGLVESYFHETAREGLAAVILYTALFVTLAEIEADPFWFLGSVPKVLVIAAVAYMFFALPGGLPVDAEKRE